MTDIKMPKMDQEMDSGGVVEWLHAVGDTVERGQPVAVIETEKVTTEVAAPASGVLEAILVEAGGECAVGETMGRIATGDGGGAA